MLALTSWGAAMDWESTTKLKLLIFIFGMGVITGCGGGASAPTNPPPASNPAPAITAITPSSTIAGSADTPVTITGSGFISSSRVQWNGTPIATTYSSATNLSATIPASNLATATIAMLTVVNPSPGGGTSLGVDFPVNNPVPAITSISPSSGTVGSAAFALTVTGTRFLSTSQVVWNGSQLATTYVSSTSLTAQILASDLTSAGTATVAVQNPTPGGGTSGNLTFTINPPGTNLTVLDVEGTDLAWNSSQQKLYVAVPAAASTNASTITLVDPIAGSITGAQQLSSAASGLAISDDSQYLYAVTNGGSTIQRFTLPAITPDIEWPLGKDPTSGNANLAGDIKVQPGAPGTLAVSFGEFGSGSVGVFDNGVERSAVGGGGANAVGNSLQWKQDGSELYAAYTIGNDSPFYTTVSDDALYVMPVNGTGVGAVTTYDSSFRAEGVHLHSDPAAGYVYGDWGEVFNTANGIPIGNYRYSRPAGTIFPGPLSIVDPGLKRFYTLFEISEPDGTLAFQIQAFDQTQFQLLHTLVIPNGVGQPTNFIRWGQAGLAFVTNGGSSSTAGKLYILDGSIVNPSGALDTPAGTQIYPVPTLTAISPLTTTVDGQAVTLTVTGRDFIGQPTVFWNGNALPTTTVSSTEISAQVPASDLTAIGQATITVSNTASALPASNAMPFSVNAAPPTGTQISVYSTGGNDLVWNATAAKIYVSMPGVQGDSGDAIGIIDPVAGSVSSSGFLGSDPARISLSDDGQYFYVALYGENAVHQLTLPGFTVNTAWNLGGVGTFGGPYYALDLQVAPGASQTTAVTLATFDLSPSSAAVVIYDGPTPRPTPLQSLLYPYSGLKWAGNASTLYAVDQQVQQDFLVLGVGSSGAVLNQHYVLAPSTYSAGIHFDPGTGLVYTDAGEAIQPSNGSEVGNYGASGIVVPDSTLGRVFILGQTSAQAGTSSYTIESFDQTHFTPIGSITIQNVVGTPTSFIRWGSNGLAFTTRIGGPADFQGTGPGQLYVVSGNFVNPASSSQSLAAAQLLPVRRTWRLGTTSKHQSQPVVLHPSPWRQ